MHSHGYQHHHSTHDSARSILFAFLLNLTFSLIEFLGGLFLNSVAIMSDSLHSFGDAFGTGISFVFERISQHHPATNSAKSSAKSTSTPSASCTRERYSLIGAAITTIILFISSVVLIYEAIERILNPAEVNADGMIIFAIFGVALNFLAARLTRHGHSLNQRSVNLHMLEDCFAWLAVLLGAIVMRLTGLTIIDPILSIGVALFTLYYALQNTRLIISAFHHLGHSPHH